MAHIWMLRLSGIRRDLELLRIQRRDIARKVAAFTAAVEAASRRPEIVTPSSLSFSTVHYLHVVPVLYDQLFSCLRRVLIELHVLHGLCFHVVVQDENCKSWCVHHFLAFIFCFVPTNILLTGLAIILVSCFPGQAMAIYIVDGILPTKKPIRSTWSSWMDDNFQSSVFCIVDGYNHILSVFQFIHAFFCCYQTQLELCTTDKY